MLMEQYANDKRVNIPYQLQSTTGTPIKFRISELVKKSVLFCPCQITMYSYTVQCCLSWYLVYYFRARRRSAIRLSSVANCFSLSSAIKQREFPCATNVKFPVFTLLIQFFGVWEKRRDICLQAFTFVLKFSYCISFCLSFFVVSLFSVAPSE